MQTFDRQSPGAYAKATSTDTGTDPHTGTDPCNAVLDMRTQGLEPEQRRIAFGFPERGEIVRWGIVMRTLEHGAAGPRKCWQSSVSERWYDIILHEGALIVQLSHGNCPHRIRPLLHR